MTLFTPFRTLSRRRLSAGMSLTCAVLCTFLLLRGAQADKTAADYFVRSLPGAPDGPLLKMHAGHIEVDPVHNGNLFFWHFQNQHIADRQRTVIWLNGGPGCSSMDGALMEVGPYRLQDDGKLRYNEGSWDEFTNLLFVDQPVGTGFSYVNTDSYLHELKEMADQFIVFLEKFFAVFPQYEHEDLYIAGESYAGQHIPYVAQAILERNKKPDKRKWMLRGLLIGNGWIAPTDQYLSTLPMAYKDGLVQGDSDIAKQLESQQALCMTRLNEPGGTDRVDIPECEKILSKLLELTQSDGKAEEKCTNMYDDRLRDSWPSCGMNWPPDLERVTPYLRRQDVISALHVDADKKTGWTECAGTVGSAFKARNSKPSIYLLPALLEQMPIVLFSGDKDLICNHVGTEELIHNMAWNGARGFELSPGTWAPRRAWTFEGEPAGLYQEARNLTYILFYNASHMVPFDYPRRTRDMLDRFVGVDIATIGGVPADSRIDGEKGLEVSVGGHPNSTVAKEKEAQKLKQAKWDAYYRSGEIALVVVVIAASGWAWFVWRDRARHNSLRRGRYQNIPLATDANGAVGPAGRHGARHPRSTAAAAAAAAAGLEDFRRKRSDADLEAADFDETELDDLRVGTPREDSDEGSGRGAAPGVKGAEEMERERFALGVAESDDDEDGRARRGLAAPPPSSRDVGPWTER